VEQKYLICRKSISKIYLKIEKTKIFSLLFICLDCREKVIIFDQEIMKYLSEMGITTVSQLQRLNKSNGIMQSVRIPGISKSVIDRL
jgi:hypothetical protein